MTKSNGITSLKQAAKLLNKHSPDGESLAYINPEEAKLLRASGGSGIKTLQGVPSYASIFGWDVPFTGTKNWGEVAGDVYTWLGYGKQPAGKDEDDKPVYTQGRSIVQDAVSTWAYFRAKKDKEGLNAAEMEQFNKLNQQLAAAETEFDVSTDFGTQLKAPQYTTDVADVAAYTPIDFSGETTPELITTPIATPAEGGRIGAFNGGIQGLMPQQAMPQQAMPQQAMPQQGMLQQGFMPQQGMPQQGMLQQGLDPRMGYAAQGGRIGYNRGRVVNPGGYAGEEWITQKNDYDLTNLKDPFVPGRIDREGEGFYQDDLTGVRDPFKTSPEMIEIQKDYDIESMRDPFKPSEIQKLVQEIMKLYEDIDIKDAIALATKMLRENQITGQAQGGRIGYNLGGIDRPFQGVGALNRMGYRLGDEVEQVTETVEMPENIQMAGTDTPPIEIQDLQTLLDAFYEAFGRGPTSMDELKRWALQRKKGAHGGRIGAADGYPGPHLNMPTFSEGVNQEFPSNELGVLDAQSKIDVSNIHGQNKEQQIQKLIQEIMGLYEDIDIKDAIGLARQILEAHPERFAQGGRIGAQGGGIMPLLDMGGMEKDYRQEGGFVPIGRKEKADDVPARLSKNEFVFTADAVKAAGGGDIDEGAQRMYNVMKNLEAGGEISEQSQGKA